ncbi:HD domain-containing protein [Flexistipes sp.]|uniref:HD domain-containing protein n=1 Tax=Flexistipes sp. TaxID=3088135 RepID=UPI002E1E695F|nr:HD domain-containing protein [Flexistipes sp.]
MVKYSDLLGEIDVKHRFRDPIYGFIWLTEDELKIVDSELFQRLRRIHQLALTKYVYPAAENTRFPHSLGVLQSATNIFLELYRNNYNSLNEVMGDTVNLFKELRFAALLHDIGHMPFSHATEDIFLDEGTTHEDVSKHIVLDYKPFLSIFKKNNIKPEVIANLFKGKLTSEYRILKKILSDSFDADRADYLLRDSYMCGVKYGLYDFQRFISSFDFSKKTKDFTIKYGNIHSVESLLLARYYYNMQVPFHRTRKGYDIVLKKFIEKYKEEIDCGIVIEDGKLKMDFEQFFFFDDNYVFEIIKRKYKEGDKFAKTLMRGENKLHAVFDLEVKAEEKEYANEYGEFIQELKEKGFKENEDYFKFKETIKIHKLIKQSDEKEETDYVVIKDGKEYDLLDLSAILKSLKEPIVIYRVYIVSEKKGEAEKIYKNLKERHKKIKGNL